MSSGTSHEHSLKDVFINDSKNNVRSPMNAEEHPSHTRSMPQYATLKLNRVWGIQVLWPEDQYFLLNIKAPY